MRDLLTRWPPCLLWLLAAGLNLREALAYRRARRACEAMQARASATLLRTNAALEEEG